MSEKRNTPTGAATSAGAGTEAALTGTAFSDAQSTTATNSRQLGFIESLLLSGGAIGAGNAIRTAALVRMAGLSDARSLQSEIERERAAGALILSRNGSPGGYFLPSDGEAGKREIAVYVSTLRARALNTLRTIRTAKRALRVLDGQEEIADE
jgi:hypothetical protein